MNITTEYFCLCAIVENIVNSIVTKCMHSYMTLNKNNNYDTVN